jgi:hypothetical protein
MGRLQADISGGGQGRVGETKMEAARFSETLAYTNQSTRRLTQKNIIIIVTAVKT